LQIFQKHEIRPDVKKHPEKIKLIDLRPIYGNLGKSRLAEATMKPGRAGTLPGTSVLISRLFDVTCPALSFFLLVTPGGQIRPYNII